MNDMESFRLKISALADGELKSEDYGPLATQIGVQEELRSTWATYHLIGDVLRSGQHAPCTSPQIILSRLQQRLAAESGAPAPSDVQAGARPIKSIPVSHAAANDAVFRWKLVAGLASLATATVLGWSWMGSAPGPGTQLAQSGVTRPTPAVIEATVATGGTPQIMLRDPQLDALLEAHRQSVGASQMPSGFLRSATFETSPR